MLEEYLERKKRYAKNRDNPIRPIGDRILAGDAVHIILKQHQAPGDVLTLTASVRDLKKSFPNVHIKVKTTAMELWEHNPYVEDFHDDMADVCLNIGYPLVNKSNSCGKHFIHGMKEDIEQKLDVRFELNHFKCDVHITDEEKGWINQVEEEFGLSEPFWLINCGSKNDFPLKQWPVEKWQQVVDALKDKINFVQIGEAGHNHVSLDGVYDLVGKTDMRQLIRLTYHSVGGFGHVSMLNHLLSCWEKPSIVVAGGRESSGWEAYNTTQYVHTIGQLECCKSGGCWQSKPSQCSNMDANKFPRCMNIIKSKRIKDIVEDII